MKLQPLLNLLKTNDVLLAPMAGVTDRSFRLLCRELGCGLAYTEMVSAKGLHYGAGKQKATALLSIDPKEAPAAVQIFGSDPAIMAEQAAALYEDMGQMLALIDINMGCPAHKIVGNGEGSAMMRKPAEAAKVIEAVSRAVPLPVTVKFRKGWDDDSVNAVEFAQMAEASGASMVTVHGRTRMQQYAGKADWDIIAAVKEAVSVPVIGNGDVFAPEDYFRMKAHTGCDGVMIARGAQGNPWLFAQIAAIKRGEPAMLPTPEDRVDMALRHARGLMELKTERALVEMRKHVAWYIKGLKGAAAVRDAVNKCTTYQGLSDMLYGWLEQRKDTHE